MRLEIRLSEEVKQELDNLNEKIDTELVEAKTKFDTEIVELKKGVRQLVKVHLISKAVMTAAILATVVWVTRDKTN